jgi:hypothetical protein
MQGLDEDFLANPGFPVNQQRNVFLQQALGLAHGLFHATVAKVQGLQADGGGFSVRHGALGVSTFAFRNSRG